MPAPSMTTLMTSLPHPRAPNRSGTNCAPHHRYCNHPLRLAASQQGPRWVPLAHSRRVPSGPSTRPMPTCATCGVPSAHKVIMAVVMVGEELQSTLIEGERHGPIFPIPSGDPELDYGRFRSCTSSGPVIDPTGPTDQLGRES
jgi:hypothetical protein